MTISAPPNTVGMIVDALIGHREFMPLTDEEFGDLKQTFVDIDELIDVEQKFDVLLSNFVELEVEMAERTIRHYLQSERSPESMFDDQQTLNRRVVNVMTSAKLYIDQTKQHVSTVFGKNEKSDELKSLFSREYDAHLGYRTMEALRNYGQHKGLPLQGFTHHTRLVDVHDPQSGIESNVAISISVEELSGDGKFKAATLTELRLLGNYIDIKPMMRRYIESLAIINDAFRAAMVDRIDAGKARLTSAMQRFKGLEKNIPSDQTVAFVRVGENGIGYKVLRRFPTYSLEHLKALQSKNSATVNLRLHHITTAPLLLKA